MKTIKLAKTWEDYTKKIIGGLVRFIDGFDSINRDVKREILERFFLTMKRR